jgi:hypothetical protein
MDPLPIALTQSNYDGIANIVYNEQLTSLSITKDDLISILKSRNVYSDEQAFGADSKPIDDLFKEITSGECYLQNITVTYNDDRSVDYVGRVTNIHKVDIVRKDEKHLYEMFQTFPNSSKQPKVKLQTATEKVDPSEEPQATITRCIKEELGTYSDNTPTGFEIDMDNITVNAPVQEPRFSKSYPTLFCVYVIGSSVCILKPAVDDTALGLRFNDTTFATSDIQEGVAKKTLHWQWLTPDDFTSLERNYKNKTVTDKTIIDNWNSINTAHTGGKSKTRRRKNNRKSKRRRTRISRHRRYKKRSHYNR